MADNPFFETWDSAAGLPPFARLRPEHFPSALTAALAAHRAEIAAILANRDPAGFANTLEPLERAGRQLSLVSRCLDTLASNLGDPAIEALELEWAPVLAEHDAAVTGDAQLYARLMQVPEEGLEEDQRRLLAQHRRQMRRAGAGLDAPGRARMLAIAAEASRLETEFAQNVTRAERDWTLALAEADLDGLSADFRAALKAAAEERGEQGWLVTLSRSVMEQFLAQSTRRDLRRAVHQAWSVRAAEANAPLVPRLLALRAERARLLGFANHAEYALDGSMAGSPQAAMALLEKLWEAGRARALAEQAELQALADADGLGGPIQAWDWAFYAERLRQERHGIDEAALKPYLPLDRVLEAAFDTAHRLFGVRFTERPDLQAWHPDARSFAVTSGEATLGLFVMDNYARPGKRSGAWMSSLSDAAALTGAKAVVTNDNNIARGNPTLLSWDDARTVFHELGHALHGLLSTVRYPSQSGTNVEHDFVEFPSQVLENWLATPAVLDRHARHVETGAPIPAALRDAVLGARNFNQGFFTTALVGSALLDMALHSLDDPAGLDPAAFEAAFLTDRRIPEAVGLRHRTLHFSHLFGGSMYAAGYYAYLWAEVLDADGFAAFEESGDVFDAELAGKLRAIYAAGGARDPMALYLDFRGRPPQEDALLRARGLI
ncbi:M3 family metallopeptidase [Roseomonas sp. USHLN139]|uniref:M3 family metallopeptidase n=1 Tax=Roseomonas sp. USHLN139 TaxID=3081298 RepID=UPI003B023FFA